LRKKGARDDGVTRLWVEYWRAARDYVSSNCYTPKKIEENIEIVFTETSPIEQKQVL
jgi:hypothetical protein